MSIFDVSLNEDPFYENLTLGLTKLLETIPRIKNVTLEKRLPCDRLLLNSWEQRHCCPLPEDLRQFYASTDGFKLIWSYEYCPEEILQVGMLHIPALGELTQPTGLKESLEQNPPKASYFGAPCLGPKSKILEIEDIDNIAKVCLVYESLDQPARVWLLDSGEAGVNLQWALLANSFSQYLRMAIVHLGLPQWQLCFSQQGLLPWAEQLFMLVAPHLLPGESSSRINQNTSAEPPENTVDPSIFKPKQRSQKQTGKSNKN